MPLTGLRGRVDGFGARMDSHLVPDRVVGPSPLRDRTYLTSVALNSVIAMQFGLTSVGVPLWIVTQTEAPEIMISALLVLNTVFVALFQVRAARGTHDIRHAGRVVRRGSLLLAAACLLYGAAGSTGAVAAVLLLLPAELLGSCAEVWCEAGGWGLAFELADPLSAGRYQGISTTGYAIGGMMAPALVTATAVDHGLPGWAFLAVVFALAGAGVGLVAGRAADRRTAERSRWSPDVGDLPAPRAGRSRTKSGPDTAPGSSTSTRFRRFAPEPHKRDSPTLRAGTSGSSTSTRFRRFAPEPHKRDSPTLRAGAIAFVGAEGIEPPTTSL